MGCPPPAPPVSPPKAQTDWTLVTWRCEYCKRPNWRTGLSCEGCGAPEPERKPSAPPPFRPDLDLIVNKYPEPKSSLLENIMPTIVGVLTLSTILAVLMWALFYAP